MSVKNKINKLLRRFNVEMHGTGYLQALAKGELRKNEMDVFKKVFGTKNIIIYDVGANRGTTIKSFLNEFNQAHIHAFEPQRALCDNMMQDYHQFKNVTINNCGISDTEGSLVFNINRSVDTSSFLASQKTGLNSDKQVETLEQVTVPVTTIDKYAASHQHEKINILKLDIQGSELNALKGAGNCLKQKKIDMIFCEAYFVQQYEKQPLFFDTASFLLAHDYVLQDIYHPVYGKGKIAWCDAMFIPADFKM